MIVLFYDSETGSVLECAVGPQASIEADGRPFFEIEQFRPDWDLTHRIEGGALVAITAEG